MTNKTFDHVLEEWEYGVELIGKLHTQATDNERLLLTITDNDGCACVGLYVAVDEGLPEISLHEAIVLLQERSFTAAQHPLEGPTECNSCIPSNLHD